MTLLALFRRYMKDVIQLEVPSGSYNADGSTQWEPPLTYTARWVKKGRLFRTADGNTGVSNGLVQIYAGPDKLSSAARLTLPDGTQPPILQVNRFTDARHGAAAGLLIEVLI